MSSDMIRSALFLIPLTAAVLAGCASAPPAPGGLLADRFVTLNCAENKSFQARYAADGRTIRVRSHAGAAELERQANGRFAGDGFTLDFSAPGGASLDHSGKSQGKDCKRSS